MNLTTSYDLSVKLKKLGYPQNNLSEGAVWYGLIQNQEKFNFIHRISHDAEGIFYIDLFGNPILEKSIQDYGIYSPSFDELVEWGKCKLSMSDIHTIVCQDKSNRNMADRMAKFLLIAVEKVCYKTNKPCANINMCGRHCIV